jgi:ABC-type transport system involved in multi-copper enzyme maturation permease subunit
MRLFSEEKRSGSLEVLLSAPVNEASIVIGKFLGCWVFYMLTWLPFWLFLVALRYMGEEEFDYRPVLSFTIAMAVISAGLLAMGVFFSSLTSNQIVAAVFTFVAVIAHLGFHIIRFNFGINQGTTLHEVLTFVNFLDYWRSALGGLISPRHMVFHFSVAVFFLFATVKVLESRKWK